MASLTINPITQPTAGVPFTVSGNFLGGVSGLQYADGSKPLKALPLNPGSSQTVVSWTFTHPAAPAGPLTIKVTYPGVAGYTASVTVIVKAVTSPPPTPTPTPVPPGPVPTPTITRHFSDEFTPPFN